MARKPTELELATKSTIQASVRISAPLLEAGGYDIEAWERTALNCLLYSPKIQNCTPGSVGRAIMQCVEMGLLPDGREAAIVPYGKKATLIPMIRGRRKMARAAIAGLYLRDRIVYSGDHFIHEEGMAPRLVHRPSQKLDADRSDEQVLCAYGVARVPGADDPEFEVLYVPELLRSRSRSIAWTKGQEGRRGPWESDFAEMCRKTAMGAVLKRLPQKPGFPEFAGGIEEIGDALAVEGAYEDDTVERIDWDAAPAPARRRRTKAAAKAPVEDAEIVDTTAAAKPTQPQPQPEPAPAPAPASAPAAAEPLPTPPAEDPLDDPFA